MCVSSRVCTGRVHVFLRVLATSSAMRVGARVRALRLARAPPPARTQPSCLGAGSLRDTPLLCAPFHLWVSSPFSLPGEPPLHRGQTPFPAWDSSWTVLAPQRSALRAAWPALAAWPPREHSYSESQGHPGPPAAVGTRLAAPFSERSQHRPQQSQERRGLMPADLVGAHIRPCLKSTAARRFSSEGQ